MFHVKHQTKGVRVMSSATLTIMGLYTFNPNLFSKMVMPEGIDHELLIDTIVMRGGDYEVVYPNPELMEYLIGTWSRTWLPTFTNWKRASDDISEVAPLENYDRLENWTDTTQETTESTGSTSSTGNTTGSDSSHGTGTVTNNTTNSGTTTSKISAEDNTDFVNKTQDIDSSTQNNTQGNITDTSASTSTSSTSATDSESNMNHDAESVHGGRVHGNIGVTTSAQMYAEFITTLHKYGNIYEAIASTFCQNFVIPIL